MESKNPGENEQVGICPRLFSFFVTGMAFHRWKRFIHKRPVEGEGVVVAHVDDTLVGNLAEVRDATKEDPASDVLPEKNINQGKNELFARSKTENEIQEQTEDEKEKGMKKEKEKEKDVTVQNNNNDKEGVSGSVQAPIKGAILIAAPSLDAEKETRAGTVGPGTGAATARRRTRTRTKKSVSFKDEREDANEAQKKKEKEKEEGVQQKQHMDMNTKFQKFIDEKKQAMRQGSGVGRKPSS